MGKHNEDMDMTDADAPEGMTPPETVAEAAAGTGGGDSAEEMAKLKDQMLRALAESENARRRMQKEIEDTRKYAVGNFAKDMLTIADNFRRALEAVPQDAAGGEAMKTLLTGVEAIERQMLSTMERFGIVKLEPLGQTFDPHFHRVMMEQDNTGKAAGTIVQVFQPGYMIHDRLLREALVAVAKGEPVQAGRVDTSA